MNDLISRQTGQVTQTNASNTLNTLDCISRKERVMKNADKFKGIFGIYATELWAKQEKEFFEWLNEDVPGANVGDTISRQAAIDAINSHFGFNVEEEYGSAVQEVINSLPSAQPEQRKGEWIDEGFYADGHGAHAFRCSECGGHIIEYDADPFCRWCGADMTGEQDG